MKPIQTFHGVVGRITLPPKDILFLIPRTYELGYMAKGVKVAHGIKIANQLTSK